MAGMAGARALIGGLSALALLAGCSTSQETYAVATASAGSAVAVATARVVGAPAPAAPPAASPSAVSPQAAPSASERYPEASANPMVRVAEAPVSTFSVDVDTSAYSQVRRALREGRMPRPEAVRVEELVNYFDYAYPAPADRAAPFQTMVGVVPTPWNPRTRLMQIGLRGYDVPRDARPRANLVFLVDTSGSMDEPDRMPLVKQTLGHLIDQLGPQDRVAIVTYAGASAVALPPTAGSERERIRAVVDGLNAYGSTAGGAGIQTAYELAEKSFDREAVNRVILATDGDFNVGVSDPKELERIITEKRRSGVYLTALGYGTGNLNEAILQRLAQAGNGNAAYVDSALEARRVMVDELSSTLFPIADDVKVQVEFNPVEVAEYRLIGYETRALKREDFNNDSVDAGEIGAGHTVTALYEITPAGAAPTVDPLRYQTSAAPAAEPAANAKPGEMAFVRLRYKLPGQGESRLIERPVTRADSAASLDGAPADIRFAAAVAAFGRKLRGDADLAGFGYDRIAELAQGARGEDPNGLRAEFVQLVRAAR